MFCTHSQFNNGGIFIIKTKKTVVLHSLFFLRKHFFSSQKNTQSEMKTLRQIKHFFLSVSVHEGFISGSIGSLHATPVWQHKKLGVGSVCMCRELF